MPTPSFTRALRIASYNRPLYITAALGILLGTTLAALPFLPLPLRLLAALGALAAAWLAAASFLAFHAMFDRSNLLTGQWLKADLPNLPATWVQLNVGLEETTLPLHEVFPTAQGRLLDLYDPALMTEPAVTRAKADPAPNAPTRVQPNALPLDSASTDLTLVTLAAHEIRNPQTREQFFLELARITAPTGRIVIVEHLRNLPAALAFGPGILHFYPRSLWLKLAHSAHLTLDQEHPLTPFIHVFIFKKP